MSKVDVVPVRRRDLRQPAYPRPGTWLPPKHGDKGDPRYPSPKTLRVALSFVIDLVVHAGLPAAAAVALAKSGTDLSGYQLALLAFGGFVGLSILDRIFVQYLLQATIGKGLTALRMVRDDNGHRPTLWMLTKAWFIGVFAIIATAAS